MCLRLHELEGKLKNELTLRTEAESLISRMLEEIVRLLQGQIISKEASDALMMIVKQ